MLDYYRRELQELEETGNLRQFREIDNAGYANVLTSDGVLRSFSSNDYLGIASDHALRAEYYQMYDPASPELATSSASSRLLTGNTSAYTRLEAALDGLYQRSSLVFSSGYHANIGILPALTTSGDTIFSDKLNHASIIDALRLSDAQFKRYKHLDLDHLESLLRNAPTSGRRFIVTESVFSMDGDRADLRALAALKKKYDAMLIVDEAHAVGLFGARGLGLSEEQSVLDEIDILVGTFGKALGSTGAYAICHDVIKKYLTNRMRSLIFTTALPPVVLNWSSFILKRLPGMNERRTHLQRMGTRLRTIITQSGYETSGDTHIVPLKIGDNARSLELAERFRKHGMLLFAIRPPTVPPGGARLRFSLSAALTNDDIESVSEVLHP